MSGTDRNPCPPQLLVSVRDVADAAAALAGGADWIDLKEPMRGPLGAVDAKVASDVVTYALAEPVAHTMAGRRTPVSAAAGELQDWPHSAARQLMEVSGLTHLKLGLAGCRDVAWQANWSAAQAEVERSGKQLVAVIYADDLSARAPRPAEVLELAASVSCQWVLFDTFDKSSSPLNSHLLPHELHRYLRRAAGGGMCAALAGRLTAEMLDQLPLELAHMVGIRGAACRGDRASAICRHRVRAFREALQTSANRVWRRSRAGRMAQVLCFSGRNAVS